jgi:hypothetical protein
VEGGVVPFWDATELDTHPENWYTPLMTNQPVTAAVRAALVKDIDSTKATIAMGGVYPAQWAKYLPAKEARLAEFDRVQPDVDSILAMGKAAIRAVPDALFDLVQDSLWASDVAYELRAVFGAEVTRRKAARTKAARAVEQASRLATMTDFLPGQTVGVHAFGHWYTGKVIRTTRSGSVVVEYTSGTGTTRQKTVGYDKIRA